MLQNARCIFWLPAPGGGTYVPRGSCTYASASRIAAMGVESHNNS